MGTLIQDTQQRNPDSQPRWDRLERADLFSIPGVANPGPLPAPSRHRLKVPRTTLQAWRRWHDSLDICPHVAEFFQSGPGLAFVHRLVVGFHLVCVEVGRAVFAWPVFSSN